MTDHHSTVGLIILLLAAPTFALDNGLARTPAMGWNSWNQVRCNGLNEGVVKAAADTLVSTGLAAKGYNHVVIDDCWQAGARDASGNLQPNATKFPNGIKAVADYVHSKGLKFGLYASPGTFSCANIYDGYPYPGSHLGSYGHEEQDAAQWVSWGLDYLKYDWCLADRYPGLQEEAAFTLMRDVLNATGRPIEYSISEYGQQKPWEWAAPIANSWRTTGDVFASWAAIAHGIQEQVGLWKYSGPGAWNDPDMLQIGNGGLTLDETRSHFALWTMLASPLFLGTDIAKLSPDVLAVVGNPRAIAIDQDPLGRQAQLVQSSGSVQLWTRPLAGDRQAFAVYNTGADDAVVTVTLQPSSSQIIDVWSGASLVATPGPQQPGKTFTVTVPKHGTAYYTHQAPNGNPSIVAQAVPSKRRAVRYAA